MRFEMPVYYTRLAPFAAAFARAVPMLTYHKLGRRPGGVRLKGVYVPKSLFEAQLAELAASGFVSVEPARALAPQGTPRRIVLSFDDGYRNVLRHGLPLLRRYGFTAISYLVADRIGGRNEWDIADGEAPEALMDDSEIRAWLAAGQRIGSHGLEHRHLTRLAPALARAELSASRRRLEDRYGVAVTDFCYPYGDWNPAVAELAGEAGYRTACTTEFGLNRPGVDPLALRRITVRYRSWSPRHWLGGPRAAVDLPH